MTALADPHAHTIPPLTLTRHFAAPRALVFEAWTTADHLSRWSYPAGFTVVDCVVDFRIGGSSEVVMRSPEGELFHWRNHYQEIVTPERIVVANAILSRTPPNGPLTPLFDAAATISFAEAEGGTLLTVEAAVEKLHDPAAAPLAAAMEPGWTDGLDHLAAYLRDL